MSGEIGVVAGFFLFVLATISAAGYFLFWRRSVHETRPASTTGPITLPSERTEPEGVRELLVSAVHTLGEYMPTSEGSRRVMRERLAFAGYRSAAAPTVFTGVKWGVALLVAALFGFGAATTRDEGTMVFSAAVCGLGLGFLIPERILDSRIRNRNERLRRAIAPALDLIIMSLEAGHSLDSAVLSAGRGLRNLFPDLSAEFNRVHLQMKASKSRAEAIRYMAEQNSESELRKLCSLLVESDRFGTSLAPALRQHAKYLRIRFRQRAQEAARKLTVKLVFPVFFLIFPSILVITLGPAALMMYKYLGQIVE